MLVPLHSTSCSSCGRPSSERSVQGRFCLSSPARTICSVLFHSRGDVEEGEGIAPLGSLSCEDPRAQSKGMLTVQTEWVCPLLWENCPNSSVKLLLSVI